MAGHQHIGGDTVQAACLAYPLDPDASPARPNVAEHGMAADFAELLITSRSNISPRRLVAPGPGGQQVNALLRMALAAPDHGQLTPWRFVSVRADRRELLAEAFALALIDRAPQASQQQIEAAREKAHRAPFLMVAIARLDDERHDIGPAERLVSLGAAIQNILLGAHALGYGAGLTSGQAMDSPRMRRLLRLGDHERAVCCINIGTVGKARPPRTRPDVGTVLSEL